MLGTLTHVTATWVKVPSKADVNDLKWTVGPIENFKKLYRIFFLPYLALILCWSIDGVACISIFYYMEMLDHAISHVWLHFFNLPPYVEGEKNHPNIAFFAFDHGRNSTQAVCSASVCAIHYNIVSQQLLNQITNG